MFSLLGIGVTVQAEAIELKQFDTLQDDACEQRIVTTKAVLEKRAIILAHHC